MKKLMSLAISFLFVAGSFNGISSVVANVLPGESYSINLLDDDQRTEVKLAELPQAVKDVLESDDYKGWEAEQTVYLVKDKATNSEYYEITLKHVESQQSKTIKLKATGEKIK
ncbi:MAG: hypothetical protein RBR84_01420 [Bacteroidales bacterium]|jgi:dTDP-D-glucose 4,6-dehydratase|nr:hypothetical protein [Bacteroidales bacterium]MDD4086993.1 hypothetical protein [Bacteroidales bacterium]MDY0084552.1 hypothetical protein [Bacteroidales bacterium]